MTDKNERLGTHEEFKYSNHFIDSISGILDSYLPIFASNSSLKNKKLFDELHFFLIQVITIIKFKENFSTNKTVANFINYTEYNSFIKEHKQSNLVLGIKFEIFKLDETMFNEIVNIISPLVKDEKFQVRLIGTVFEKFSHSSFKIENSQIIYENSIDRKDNGVFYTDPNLVAFIVSNTLAQFSYNKFSDLLRYKFLDPAMGSGYFLLELINQAANLDSSTLDKSKSKLLIAQNMIYGVDKNPVAVEVTKLCIWLEIGIFKLKLDFLDSNLKTGDSLLVQSANEVEKDNEFQHFNWKQEFPEIFSKDKEGFDAIIGNPPWGKIKSNIKEYFANKDFLYRSLQGNLLKEFVKDNSKDSEWIDYSDKTKNYVKNLKKNSFYSHQKYIVNEKTTGGDVDLYKYFLELAFHLLNKNGVLAYLIPSSFYMSESASGLRHLFFLNGEVKYLLNFENKKKIFPIHPSFKFSIFIFKKGKRYEEFGHVLFDLTEPASLKNENLFTVDPPKFNLTDISLFSYNYLTIPELHTNQELIITRKLYSTYPPLGKYIKESWNVNFRRELDMTVDSKGFVLADIVNNLNIEQRRNFIPLYEGRMVHQYDYSYKKYISGHNRSAKWEIQKLMNKEISPHFYVPIEYLKDKSIQIEHFKPRAGFCDVTGHKNERTVLSTLIPAKNICGNKVPTCLFDNDDDLRLHLLWVGISNSFVVDWLIRQKMTTTLNYFYWEQIPFPRIDFKSEVAKEIILRAAQLVYITEDIKEIFTELEKHYSVKEVRKYAFKPSQELKAELRADIEVLVANLYNLDLESLAVILNNFQSLDRRQPSLNGDLNILNSRQTGASYITRDLVFYKFLKYHKKSTALDIVELYKNVGINLDNLVGPTRQIGARICEYKKNGATAFQYS